MVAPCRRGNATTTGAGGRAALDASARQPSRERNPSRYHLSLTISHPAASGRSPLAFARGRLMHPEFSLPAVRPALRARRMWRRLRGGCVGPPARAGAAARARGPGVARPSRSVRGRRRLERRRRRPAAARDEPLLRLLAPGVGGRPGIVIAVPARAETDAAAGAAAGRTRRCSPSGLEAIAWRDVPVDPGALGQRGAREPAGLIVQASSSRAAAREPSDARFERLLSSPAGGMEIAAARPRPASSTSRSPSASSPHVVYKGLVAGVALAAFYPDLRETLAVSHVMFHQRYATNTHPDLASGPTVPAARAQRRDQHRPGNREQVRGRRGRRSAAAARQPAG